ncbi:MAG: hypothetical protein PHX51_07150 [Clostridia bacterium]|nr:hypothetical protein [Clostridia bacterium]
MPQYELYTDDLKPKPLEKQGFGFKIPEKLKEQDGRFQKDEVKLGFADYMRLINRYLVNQFAEIMNLDLPKNEPTGWLDIIISIVTLVYQLIKKSTGK